MYQGDAYGSLISELDAEGLAPAITVDGFGSVYGSSTLSYQALGYIPSALGLWLGRLLHLPFTLDIHPWADIECAVLFHVGLFWGQGP